MVDFTIVVCAYNEAANIEKCLKALFTQDYAGFDVQLIVIDNSSTDDTYTLAKACLEQHQDWPPFYDVQLIQIAHVSLSGSRNCGLSHARGRWVIYVDADGYAATDWFSKMAPHCREHLTAVGGRVRPIFSSGVQIIDRLCTLVLTNSAGAQREIVGAAMALNISRIGTLRFANGLPRGEESEFIERLLSVNQSQKHVCQDAVYYNHFPDTFYMWIKITFREGLCRYRISKWRLDHKAFHKRNLIEGFTSLSILAFPVTYFALVCLYIARVLFSLSNATRIETQKKIIFSAFYPLFFYSRRFGWLSAYLKDKDALAIRQDADYAVLSVITVLRGHSTNA